MEIAYLGHSAFKISNKQATVVTDPFDPQMVGLKFPKLEKADVVTVSHDHPDHNAIGVIPGEKFVVSGPGEFEVGGVFIRGIPSFHDDKNGAEKGKNVIYIITLDDVNVCHLGDLGHKLSDSQVDEIGNVDILLVPVGGTFTINANLAQEVAVQLEAKIIIPMHFNKPGLDQKTFGQLEGVEKFLKEMGAEGVVPQNKLSMTKEKLPETTTVVVLE